VGLVIQIQTVADQFIQIDLRGAFRAPVTTGPPITAAPVSTAVSTSVAARAAAAISTTLRASTSITTARRTILATAICLFFSHVSLRSYS
jgi:hypothetical protein